MVNIGLQYFARSGISSSLCVYGCLFTDLWPDYSANLCIEVATVLHYHDSNAAHRNRTSMVPSRLNGNGNGRSGSKNIRIVVRLVYNGHEVMIPKCGVMWCPFSVFLELLRPYAMTMEDYRVSCHNEKIK
jgi:hypothetical protein